MPQIPDGERIPQHVRPSRVSTVTIPAEPRGSYTLRIRAGQRSGRFKLKASATPVPLTSHGSLHGLRLFTDQLSEVFAFAPDVLALKNSSSFSGRLGYRYPFSFLHGPKPGCARRARNKPRPRRLSLNPWREIAAKEIYQSGPSAARVSLSIESNGRLPILTRIFGVGHIVAFPRRSSVPLNNVHPVEGHH